MVRIFFIGFLTLLYACQNVYESSQSDGYAEPDYVVLGDAHMLIDESNESLDISIANINKQTNNYPKDNNGRYINLWDRIAAKLTLDVPLNESRVQSEIAWFLKNPGYMERIVKRSEPFLFMIVEKLEKEGLPLDLALLPIVESAYNPLATSYVGAAGLWQFMPSTGTDYGLYRNWWYDSRRDVYMSTDAALDYLSYLGGLFDGDWEHALAAYNAGQGRVGRHKKRAIANNQPSDFWSLNLPKETRAYVPKLLALSYILRHKENLKEIEGFDYFSQIDNKPVITQVKVSSQIDIKVIASVSNLSVKEVRKLNPWIKRWSTPPNRAVKITLPIEKANLFSSQLAQLPKKNWTKYKKQATYIVRSGDSLNRISRDFKVPVSILKNTNNLKGSRIYKGQKLKIPSKNYTAYNNKRSSKRSSIKKAKKHLHTVKSGESLWGISRKFNVSTQQLARWNKLSVHKPLQIGERLVVYANSNRNVVYRVRSGDSLGLIARRFGVSVSDLARWNGLSTRSIIRPGQNVKIRRL